MNWYETDKNRILIADIITKAWQDPQYEEAFIAEPKKLLGEAGIDDIPEKIELKSIKNTPGRQYFVLPEEFSIDELSKLTAYVQSLLPLSPGQELVFVQNTENLQYFALPSPPNYDEISSLSLEELESVSGAAIGPVYVAAAVAVVAVAVTNAVVVAEIFV